MLVHTAPPLAIEPNVDEEERLVQSRATSVEKSRSRRTRSDVSETQQKLDNLQKRLQAAEAKRKDGMQWIGRQCANMFTQLDCKETEAKVVALLVDEDLTQTAMFSRNIASNCNPF
ncbi:hypothetical protein PHYBOEH_005477 [Phytophthora boehmeriae]|uniref:Uncharacterized protein n=1 Tax=Phytophthora boehmeriae TaxID=109152 RepID=A0A8T1WJI7_9STRA|nr:hypothetical protein PHYBOEH_005477 [Phytophthora boehmeriae]